MYIDGLLNAVSEAGVGCHMGHMFVGRVWIHGRVFLFPGIGNEEMSFPGFPGAREWRLLQYY